MYVKKYEGNNKITKVSIDFIITNSFLNLIHL